MHRYSSSLGKRPPISCELDLADPATKVPRVRFVDRSHVTVQCNRFGAGLRTGSLLSAIRTSTPNSSRQIAVGSRSA